MQEERRRGEGFGYSASSSPWYISDFFHGEKRDAGVSMSKGRVAEEYNNWSGYGGKI